MKNRVLNNIILSPIGCLLDWVLHEWRQHNKAKENKKQNRFWILKMTMCICVIPNNMRHECFLMLLALFHYCCCPWVVMVVMVVIRYVVYFQTWCQHFINLFVSPSANHQTVDNRIRPVEFDRMKVTDFELELAPESIHFRVSHLPRC